MAVPVVHVVDVVAVRLGLVTAPFPVLMVVVGMMAMLGLLDLPGSKASGSCHMPGGIVVIGAPPRIGIDTGSYHGTPSDGPHRHGHGDQTT